jgi:hypothetical protein
MVNFVGSKPANKLSASRLELLYNQYGASVYSLCLRLLADRKPAEDATVDAFLWFWRNANEWDESYAFSRLRVLAIKARVAREFDGDGFGRYVDFPFGQDHRSIRKRDTKGQARKCVIR